MGVWIETFDRYNGAFCDTLSHPSWVCGLKLVSKETKNRQSRSHPSWVCGLKHERNIKRMLYWVTPFVGVWIETRMVKNISDGISSHTLRGCVDWNRFCQPFKIVALWSHPSWVCGLKLMCLFVMVIAFVSHPSWVCGLKPNRVIKKYNRKTSHPSWVCGLKQTASGNSNYQS